MSEPTDRDELSEERVQRVREQLADDSYPEELATRMAADAISREIEKKGVGFHSADSALN